MTESWKMCYSTNKNNHKYNLVGVDMVECPEDDPVTLTLRRLMSYIYIYIYIYMERLFLMFLDHTQRRSTVGRTPLDE